MGACKDESTRYLRGLGYNVVRLPEERLRPLSLIGRYKKETLYLGPLNLLITNPPGPLPDIEPDRRATDVEGRTSSKLDLGIGISILGDLLGAMGASLDLGVRFTNAQTVQFVFKDVRSDAAVPLEIGNYLRDGAVDAGNPVLKEYVLGDGELFLLTKTIKSNRIEVRHERKRGVDASVDLPAIQGAVSGDVSVGTVSGSSAALAYEGSIHLTFGFQCFEVGLSDGALHLVAVKAGSVFLAATEEEEAPPALLNKETEGLLGLGAPPAEVVAYAEARGIDLGS